MKPDNSLKPSNQMDLLGIGLGAAQTVGNLAMAGQQHRRQKELMNIQFDRQQMLNRQGVELGKEMFEATGYGAQKRQLLEAGMNPGLLYGKGGPGGTTSTPGGGTAAGGSAPQAAYMELGQMLQAQKLKAETRLLEATAREKDANVEGTRQGITESQKRIEDITEGILNKRAERNLTNVVAEFRDIEKDVMLARLGMDQDKLMAELRYLGQQTRSALAQANVDEATQATRIQIVGLQAANLSLDNALKQAQIQLTGAQKLAVTESILQGYMRLSIDERQLVNQQNQTAINRFTAEINAELGQHNLHIAKQQADAATQQAETAQFRAQTERQGMVESAGKVGIQELPYKIFRDVIGGVGAIVDTAAGGINAGIDAIKN